MVMSRVRQSEISGGLVTTALDVETHTQLVKLADSRGMTLRSLMRRAVRWIDRLDPSEQAIVLDQISRDDHAAIAALVLRRTAQARSTIDPATLPPPDEFAEYVVSGKRPGQPASAKRKSAG